MAECRRYERELYTFFDARHGAILKEVAEKKELSGELTNRLKAALDEFAGVFQLQAGAAA